VGHQPILGFPAFAQVKLISYDYMIKHGVLKSLALYAHAGSEVFLPADSTCKIPNEILACKTAKQTYAWHERVGPIRVLVNSSMNQEHVRASQVTSSFPPSSSTLQSRPNNPRSEKKNLCHVEPFLSP